MKANTLKLDEDKFELLKAICKRERISLDDLFNHAIDSEIKFRGLSNTRRYFIEQIHENIKYKGAIDFDGKTFSLTWKCDF